MEQRRRLRQRQGLGRGYDLYADVMLSKDVFMWVG